MILARNDYSLKLDIRHEQSISETTFILDPNNLKINACNERFNYLDLYKSNSFGDWSVWFCEE